VRPEGGGRGDGARGGRPRRAPQVGGRKVGTGPGALAALSGTIVRVWLGRVWIVRVWLGSV